MIVTIRGTLIRKIPTEIIIESGGLGYALSISSNPYDQLPVHRKLIDRKNKKIGIFDLGNHILIIGMILLAIFISLNVE